MVKRKVSLNDGPSARRSRASVPEASEEVLELFFNTGIVHHEVALPDPLPDVISSFVVVKDEAGGRSGNRVRAAEPGEDPDVEIAAVEHLAELSHRWLPLPYQLSCAHCVQLYLAPSGRDGRAVRALLAIDTMEIAGAKGRHLDAALDAGRPYRPLAPAECGAFLDHADTRDFLMQVEKAGVERAPFKYAALLSLLSPLMPRIKLSRIEDHTPIEVSLVLDLGNSRSSAVLVESRDDAMLAVPLEIRDGSNPFHVSDETFGSRITFLPGAFDDEATPVATGACFGEPSIARLGREALDRALETPHRYLCSLSGPKRYLWDARPTDERWHFAVKRGHEYSPISGRILKYLVEEAGGLTLREDGPSAPADPRYAPRTMMLFAMVEILSQALGQINSQPYRVFQGKEGNPRVLKHLVVTYPSAMRREERDVYEALVRNAVLLTCYLLNIKPDHRPNWNPDGRFDPFLMVDEALAAQMVYLYQEAVQVYSGSMEEFIRVYGRDGERVRIASVDIGGGTCDVMIAEYEDRLPGTGTALCIRKLFQDGVSIAGDDVCRAIVEDILFDQILSQVPTAAERNQLVQLFSEGGSDHGAAWRTLKAKLVPYFWLPLSRCYWALAEGVTVADHHAERLYTVAEVFEAFGLGAEWSPAVLEEADRFIAELVPRFPGLNNLFFRFDRADVEAAIDRVLREPLRRYADILAQFEVDLLVLAGRTSKLSRVRELFVAEMPVAPPRIKTMATYRVSDWYPAKWRQHGLIKDPKSTVAAGATVLHLASRNRLPGLLLEEMAELEQKPIYGMYQHSEPHIARQNELFRTDRTSPPFPYTGGMVIGFRNVDSQEMDGSPLFEVRPANADVERALLEDRVSLRFRLSDDDRISVVDVSSQRGAYEFDVDDFTLALRTATVDRYWLDTGSFRPSRQLFEEEPEDGA